MTHLIGNRRHLKIDALDVGQFVDQLAQGVRAQEGDVRQVQSLKILHQDCVRHGAINQTITTRLVLCGKCSTLLLC